MKKNKNINSLIVSYGRKALTLLLSVLLCLSMISMDGIVASMEPVSSANTTSEETGKQETGSFTVTFTDWDGTELAKQQIEAGKAATAPAIPTRDGYEFTGWNQEFTAVNSDLTVVALYKALEKVTVTIYYVIEATQAPAAASYVAVVQKGADFKETIDSPYVMGYTPDQETVSFDVTNISEDITRTVTYKYSTGTKYTVNYYQQNIADDKYTLAETVTKTGETGSMTEAEAKEYTGFQIKNVIAQTEIAADGTTTVNIYYDRQMFYINFQLGEGGYGVEPIMERYGTPVNVAAIGTPKRAGYTFDGWDKTIPSTIPASNTVVTAKWKATQVKYTIVYWGENANDTNYSVIGYDVTKTAVAGTTPSTTGLSDKEFDYFTFNHADTSAVRGDGSTVINVYYARNRYTMNFNITGDNNFSTKPVMTINGKTYSTTYSFTAKYEQDISNLWPTADNVTTNPTYVYKDKGGQRTVTYYFVTWSGNGSNNTSKRLSLTADLIGDKANNSTTNYTASWSSNVYHYELHYWLMKADATNKNDFTSNSYIDSPVYRQSAIYSSNVNWEAKEIEGFTKYKIYYNNGDGSLSKPIVVNFYYTRNSYDLTFSNNSIIEKTTSYKFEADISGTSFTPNRPTGVPSDYVFKGWYTNTDFVEGTKFDFTNATMPAHDLVLYANWAKPTYEVTINVTVSNIITENVVKGELAIAPDLPDNPGYEFGGWFEVDSNKPFSFDIPITRPYNVAAKWVAKNNVPYTIKYISSIDGSELASALSATGYMDSTITVNAPAIENYLPDALSKSVTLSSALGNEAIFTYTPFTTIDYTVRYEDINGVTLKPEVTINTGNSIVTEQFISIPGYTPDYYQKTLRMTNDPSQNIITFKYTPNAKVEYSIEYYEQNVNLVGYTLVNTTTSQGPVGYTITTDGLPAPDGFYLREGISKLTGVITNSGLVLKVYYDRLQYAYTVHYYKEGTTEPVVEGSDVTGTGRYGQTVEVYYKNFDGFILVGDQQQNIEITDDESKNVAIFYYKVDPEYGKKYSYTLNYLLATDSGDVAIKSPFNSGNNYTKGEVVTLSAPDATITATDGTVYDYVKTVYADTTYTDEQLTSITINNVENGNVINYYYAKHQYSVSYDVNTGTGTAPVDANKYAPEATVTVLSENGLQKDGYIFLGWTMEKIAPLDDQNIASGTTVYQKDDTFAMHHANVTLYALWGKGYKVIYDINGATGTGPVDSTLYKAGTEATVSGDDNFAMTGYTFDGWKYENTIYSAGNKVTVNEPEVKLVAQWKINSYDYIVHHYLKGTTVKVADDDVEKAEYNSVVSATIAKEFAAGYENAKVVSDSLNQQITINVTGNEMIVYYTMPLTVTANDDTKVYDGQPLTNNKITVDGLVNGDVADKFTANMTAASTITNVGSVANQIDETSLKYDGNAVPEYYDVTFGDGTLKVTEVTDKVTVTITENSATHTYDGTSYSVSGYTAKSNNPLYTVADFTISADAKTSVSGTDANVYNMELKATDFTNTNKNFTNVEFVIVDGALTITPKALTITGETDNRTYNGEEQKLTGITTEGLLSGHTISGITYTAAGKNTGTYDGAFSGTLVIKDANGTDVTANYEPTQTPGKLTITKSAISVTITGESGTKYFNGVEQELTGITTEGLLTGHKIEGLSYRAAGTDVGEYDGVFTGTLVIKDANGTDVTENYVPTQTTGTLTIEANQTEIIIKADSAEKAYDGTALKSDKYTFTTGVLIGEDKLVVTTSGSQTDAGTSSNKVASYQVLRGTTDVTADYTFGTSVDGTLKVTPKEVKLTSGSATKVFDPENVSALVEHSVSGDDALVGEDEITCTFTGTQTYVGTSKNHFTYSFTSGNADNYAITTAEGDLTVTGEPIIPEKTTPEVVSNYKLGDQIPFVITVKNVNAEAITNVKVVDNNAVLTAGTGYTLTDGHTAVIASLAVGATVTINASHTVTSEDILAGKVGNVAVVTYGNKTYKPEAETDKIEPVDVTLDVTKTSSIEAGSKAEYGDVITYTITVKNNGNVDYHNVVVTDPLTGDSWTIAELKCQEQKEYTTTYTVTKDDVAEQKVTNKVTAVGDAIVNPADQKEMTPTGEASVTDTVDNVFPYTIHHVLVGHPEVQLAADTTSSATYSTVIDVASQAVTVEHYHFVSNSDLTIDVSGNEAYIYYTPNVHTLAIYYNYAGAGQAAESHIQSLAYNTGYDVDSPVLTGYTADKLNVNGTMPDEDVTVTVTYTANTYGYEVRYMSNNTLLASVNGTAKYNEVIKASSYNNRVFNGYHLVRTSGNLKIAETNNIMYIYYAVNEIPVQVGHQLTISYVYVDGTQAAPTYTATLNASSTYNVTSPVIEDYTADATVVQGVMGEQDIKITVTYTHTEEEIDPGNTPLDGGAWALVNLISMIVTVVLALILLITLIGKRHEKEDQDDDDDNQTRMDNVENSDEDSDKETKIKKHTIYRLVSLVLAVGSIVFFILTENMNLRMQIIDKWTIWMIVILLAQVIIAIISRKAKKDPKDEDQDDQQSVKA